MEPLGALDTRLNACAHFGGGRLRERDGKDSRGVDGSGGDATHDPLRNNAGLAASRAGHHQQRATLMANDQQLFAGKTWSAVIAPDHGGRAGMIYRHFPSVVARKSWRPAPVARNRSRLADDANIRVPLHVCAEKDIQRLHRFHQVALQGLPVG